MAGATFSDDQLTTSPTADGLHGAPKDASYLEAGQRFGSYRIERLLGRGGMGEVYEAEHLEHGRRIALKVLSQGLSDATDRARFLREGQLAAAVSHPHIVYIYGSEEIAGMPVIAMELLQGGTLKDRIEIPASEAITILRGSFIECSEPKVRGKLWRGLGFT